MRSRCVCIAANHQHYYFSTVAPLCKYIRGLPVRSLAQNSKILEYRPQIQATAQHPQRRPGPWLVLNTPIANHSQPLQHPKGLPGIGRVRVLRQSVSERITNHITGYTFGSSRTLQHQIKWSPGNWHTLIPP